METGDRKGKEVKQSCETKQSPTEGNFGFTPQWDPGDGVDLLAVQIHFKIVFHMFPRFTRYWADKPVKRPVMMLTAIITGR